VVGVLKIPGTAFFTTDQGDNYIRLNFTFVSLKDISAGVERLCEAMQELIDHYDDFADDSTMEINPIV
jgi:DNA-binding transcriptional MocR family regulator